jgi:hypothetical protein
MRGNTKNYGTNKANLAVYAVAATFAFPLIAAIAVPGTLLTALCFAVPFAGAAYLCGTKIGTMGEVEVPIAGRLETCAIR